MNLFGFEIKRKEKEQQQNLSFATETNEDGAVAVVAGGAYGVYVDLDASLKSEAELVTQYRDLSLIADIEKAIDEIVNEAIVNEEEQQTVSIILDDLEIPDNYKQLITNEFDNVQKLLQFNTKSYDIFKRWYVDGRLYFHKMIDPNKIDAGIVELRYLDPRKIRKVKEVSKKTDPTTGQQLPLVNSTYYIYSESGFDGKNSNLSIPENDVKGIKISEDSIVHVTSGITDVKGKVVLSHLHKAIKPANQLRSMEDATLIYRISRAPERRVFYIDVGNLPKIKAEQYIKNLMNLYKNKLVYDSQTGEIKDDRKFMTMMEDFWLPRREGSRGTEISQLPAGQNLGELSDVKYFQEKLYASLNVPIGRLNSDSLFNTGRSTEITKDEIKFSKFIDRLRVKFNELFLQILETQLIAKRIIDPETWEEISYKIKFRYAIDNYFAELKNIEMMSERINLLDRLTPYIGRYYSHQEVRKTILRQTDNDIQKMNYEIVQEFEDPILNPPVPPDQEESNNNGQINK